MNMVGILWQISFISILLAYGVEIGLFAGLTKLNKKSFIVLSGIYCFSIIFSLISLSNYIEPLSTNMNNNILNIYLLIALIMIIVGIITIKCSKSNKLSVLIIILSNFTLFICTLISIYVNVVIISTRIEITLTQLIIYSIVLLLMSMSISYLTSNKSNRTNKEISRLLGNYMLIFGEYFALSAVVMPRISYGLENTNGITINSAEYLIPLILITIVLFGIGMILNRKNSLLK